MQNRIDDTAILQYLNDPARQSDYQGSRKHIFGTDQELGNDPVGSFTISKAG